MMNKLSLVALLAIGILSAFAVNFYEKSPDNPATEHSQLSKRQLDLLNAPPLATGSKIDKIVVRKADREMDVFYQGNFLKTYPISLGKNPIGHKEFEGDMKTPEGVYAINDRNANSGYHKNLGISYPNEADIAYAKAHGKLAGGAIKIHGIKNGLGDIIGANHLLKDWTHGCIAVTDPEIDELFVAVVEDAMIEILP
ncbi:murein L,D-transpeptidase family protein [Moraxella lacunata]|nr:L,D-transpeptidase family protein [Moraxella lacunata]